MVDCQRKYIRIHIHIEWFHMIVAMLVFVNKGAAVMLVSPMNPPWLKLYSYANVFFCFGWKTCSLVTWVKTLYTYTNTHTHISNFSQKLCKQKLLWEYKVFNVYIAQLCRLLRRRIRNCVHITKMPQTGLEITACRWTMSSQSIFFPVINLTNFKMWLTGIMNELW